MLRPTIAKIAPKEDLNDNEKLNQILGATY